MKAKILLLISVSFILFACKKEEKKSRVMPPTPAAMVQVIEKDVYEYLDTLGTMRAVHDVNIVPQVSGQIIKINFKQGEHVKAGDVLAVIDTRPYEASVAQAKGILIQTEAQLKIDQLEVQRNEKLAKDKYIDQQTFDKFLARVEVDKGLYEANKALLRTAEINLDWCYIKAPVDGKVGFYNINVGNVVTAGGSPITTIQYIDKLYVDFVIPSQYLYDAIKVMQEHKDISMDVSYIEDDLTSSRSRKANANVVLNKIRYEAGTGILRGEVENKDYLFWPNQAVKVRLNLKKENKALLVPDICVNVGAQSKYVYKATPVGGGVYVLNQVAIDSKLRYEGDMRHIVGDIKAGDWVVTNVSQLRLHAGPFAYRSDINGRIYSEDGKLLTSKEESMAFLGKATEVAEKLRHEARAKQEAMKAKIQVKNSSSDKK